MGGERESGIGERRGAGLSGRRVERAVVGVLRELVVEQVGGRARLLQRQIHAAPDREAVIGQIGVHTRSHQSADRHRVGLSSAGEQRTSVHRNAAGDRRGIRGHLSLSLRSPLGLFGLRLEFTAENQLAKLSQIVNAHGRKLTVAPCGAQVNQDGGKPSCNRGGSSGRKLRGCG